MKLRRPAGCRSGGILRPICALISHRWSDWHAGGYLIDVRFYRPGHESRICWRCDRDEWRPGPETADAAQGAA